MTHQIPNFKHNQGIALFIALIFLFVSTLLGVTSLRSNMLNEKMTLNSVQREQALEAAEVAILAGEDFVENFSSQIIAAVITGTGVNRVPTTAAKTCSANTGNAGGICTPKEQSDDPGTNYDNWMDITSDNNSLNVWSTTGRHRTVDDAIKNAYGLNTAPKYIIEFMGFIVDNSGSSSCTGTAKSDQLTAWPYCEDDNAQFRITALATAGNYDETRVMLQTTFVVDN